MYPEQIACPHPGCSEFKRLRPLTGFIRNGWEGQQHTPKLLCPVCWRSFSVRQGSPFYRAKTGDETIYRALLALAEGNSQRATARIFGVDKDPVGTWLHVAAAQCERVCTELMQGFQVNPVQLDELWSFVPKKKRI